MKVLHVAPSFYPAHVYGGPTQSVYKLCCNLLTAGCEVKVLTTDANGKDAVLDVDTTKEITTESGLAVRYCHRIAGDTLSPTLLRLLPSYIGWADVVHLMAVYSFPIIPTLLVCKLLGKPVVWSPRGMLQRWQGSTRTNLKSVWEQVCRLAAPKRMLLHVTSEEEAAESLPRMRGFEAVLIPNGIEIPDALQRVEAKDRLRLLYLGRIHPKKGIENLLAACKLLDEKAAVHWSLKIAGRGDKDYTQAIQERINELQLADKVEMPGEVLGAAKQALFENADVLVAPSFTENFGIVIAEALAHAVPVIASRGTPWQKVEEVGCGFWVENDAATLAATIARVSAMNRRDMGQRGRKWMQQEFDWHSIAQKMAGVYQQLLDK